MLPDLNATEWLLIVIISILFYIAKFLEREVDEIQILLMEIRDNTRPEEKEDNFL